MEGGEAGVGEAVADRKEFIKWQDNVISVGYSVFTDGNGRLGKWLLWYNVGSGAEGGALNG